MNIETVNKFKGILLDERMNVLNGVRSVEGPSSSGDVVDQASSATDSAFQMRMNVRISMYLHKIDAALARMTAGTFGTCIECDEEISEKRLIARPTTELCIDCKEDQEKIESQTIQGAMSASYRKMTNEV